MSFDSGINKFSEKDFSYDFELNRFFLETIGAWPTISRRSKIRSRIAVFVSASFLVFFFVPQGCYIFLIEKDSAMKLREFGPLNFTAMAIVRYVIILWRLDRFGPCIDLIMNDWRRADETICRPVMLRYAKASRLFTKLYVSAMYGGASFYTWILPFVSGHDDGKNVTARPLPYPAEFFVIDSQTSPTYEIIFVGYSISMLCVACTATCGICTLTVKLVMHACSQFEIVVAFVKSIDDGYDDNADVDGHVLKSTKRDTHVERRINEIVRRHLYALAFVTRIDEILNEICLIDVVGGTLNICMVGYHVLLEWNNSETIGLVTYFMLWLTMVSNVFVSCYIGEQLSEQYAQVGEASFSMNWWRLTKNQTRALILVIATSQNPVKFTAGKVATLSLQTFASVMKASMAYLNALRTVM